MLLGAVAVLLYLPSLGTRQVVSNDEARYMVIARDLLVEGERLLPRRDGQAYLSNLYLWVVAAAGLASGLTEFSARLPSALAGIGGVLVTYLLGRRLFGARAGLLSALLLATSGGYFWHTRTVGPDLPFTFFALVAFLAFDLGRRAPAGRRYFLLFFFSAGMATSLAGLVGLLFPLLTVLLYLGLRREMATAKAMGWGWGLMVAGSVVGFSVIPPFLAAGRDGVALVLLGGIPNLPDSLLSSGETLLAGFLPWSLLLPSAVAMGLQELRRRGLTSPVLFPLLWSMLLFALLALVTVRRSGHLLPLYAALSLLIGWAWEVIGSGTFARGWRLALEVPVGVLGIGAATCGLALASGAGIPVPGPAAPFLSGESSGAFLLGLTAVVAGVLSLLSLLRGRRELSILILVLLVIPTVRGIEGASLSRYNQHHGLPALAKVVRGLLDSALPVRAVEHREPVVELYAGRELPVIRAEDLGRQIRSGSAYLLAQAGTLSRLRSVFSQPPAVLAKADLGRSAVLLVSSDPPSTGTCHVVVVSVDGLRPDAIERFQTPVLTRLAREGAFTWKAETLRLSKTLPAHVAMLAGVGPEKSGVSRNSWAPGEPRIERPTLFAVARQAGFETAMFTGKGKFGYLAQSGTIDHLDVGSRGDAAVMAAALDYLSSARPGFTFIHLGDTDRAGHHSGWMSPGQGGVIEEVDRLIGRLVERLTSGPGQGPFLLIVTADHGGEGRKHYRRWFLWPSWRAGFNRVPWIAWGETVKHGLEITRLVWVYDTAPTVLYALGLGSPLDWDGRPLNEIFVAPPWKPAAPPVHAAPFRPCRPS